MPESPFAAGAVREEALAGGCFASFPRIAVSETVALAIVRLEGAAEGFFRADLFFSAVFLLLLSFLADLDAMPGNSLPDPGVETGRNLAGNTHRRFQDQAKPRRMRVLLHPASGFERNRGLRRRPA